MVFACRCRVLAVDSQFRVLTVDCRVSLSVDFIVSWFSGVVVGCLCRVSLSADLVVLWFLSVVVGRLCQRILVFHGFRVSLSGVGC